jgi:Uma2 family endonuclease
MGKESTPSEQRIILEKVSWQKYEVLLADMEENRTSRFTFDRGRLEMMTPLDEHERCHKLVESLILVLTDELKLPIEVYKAPTLKRSDLNVGTEPDTGYYVQHAVQMRHKTQIDLATDPPPDVILEVALNKSAIDKLPIYAALGIPEVWRYISQPGKNFFKGTLALYCLQDHAYTESLYGYAFPFLPAPRVQQFIDQSDALGLATALRVLREWVQNTI